MFKVFSASWCPNCVILKKMFDDNDIPYTVVDCDTDEGMTEASALNIRALPVTLIIKGDVILRQVVGLQPLSTFFPHVEKLTLADCAS